MLRNSQEADRVIATFIDDFRRLRDPCVCSPPLTSKRVTCGVGYGCHPEGGAAMKTLREIMRPGFIFGVQRDASVADAARTMTTNNVGIVVVLAGDRLVGVFSERDIVRRVVDRGLDPAATLVAEVMTTDLVVAQADDDYRSAMRMMDQSNIRHLPVVGGDRLLSMLSIRDLIRVDLEDKGQEIRALHEYLYQVPPGGAS
jgi:CBS domain-containing protein